MRYRTRSLGGGRDVGSRARLGRRLRGGFAGACRPRRTNGCQIASKSDPHFAPNRDPCRREKLDAERLSFLMEGAVGKWPAGATVESLAEAGHLSTAVASIVMSTACGRCSAAVLKPPAGVAGLDDVAVVGHTAIPSSEYEPPVAPWPATPKPSAQSP